MDERVARLKSPEDCEQFAKNVEERGKPELALQARRRALELRAEQRGAKTKVEQEALQAIYAYEEVLTRKNGRRTSASRTWQMIKRHGILPTIERAVNRNTDASGYTALVEMGMQDWPSRRSCFDIQRSLRPRQFKGQTTALKDGAMHNIPRSQITVYKETSQ